MYSYYTKTKVSLNNGENAGQEGKTGHSKERVLIEGAG
jgi:hypothetical protein